MRLWDVIALTKSYFSITSVTLLTVATSLLAGLRSLETLLMLVGFFILLTAALNSYNNLMDARADAITKKGFPIPAGMVSMRLAAIVATSLYAAALALLTALSLANQVAGLVLGLDVILSYLYSAPHVRLKRIPVVKGAILVSHSLLFPFSAASIIAGGSPLDNADRLAILFIMGMAGHTLQDFGDIEGDKLLGDNTLPIILGVRGGVYATISMYILALFLSMTVIHTLQTYTIILLTLQTVLPLLLLRRIGLWSIVFKVNALLSIATVATVLYSCC
jgi:chlorophyll synthase